MDITFNYGGSGFNSAVISVTLQPDGKILTGGFFGVYNGVVCNGRVARLNADGSIDVGFNAGPGYRGGKSVV